MAMEGADFPTARTECITLCSRRRESGGQRRERESVSCGHHTLPQTTQLTALSVCRILAHLSWVLTVSLGSKLRVTRATFSSGGSAGEGPTAEFPVVARICVPVLWG